MSNDMTVAQDGYAPVPETDPTIVRGEAIAARLGRLIAERDALRATVERVEKLAEKWEDEYPAHARHLRVALGPESEYHDGALYGIRHPGKAEGCTYCSSTVEQAKRWGTPLPGTSA